MNDRPFDSYRYSAFISYATADDEAWNAWVSCFTDELNLALGSRLRFKVPPAHLSGDVPLLSGRLSDKLRKNVDDSFAMFLFVHDNYLASDWCLKELEYFKSLLGDEGLRERLYLIAMSESAIDALMKRDAWKSLCSFDDLTWLPFFQSDRPDRPIEIYASNARNKRVVVANAFWNLFVDLRDELATKIRNEVEREPRAPSYPSVAASQSVPLPDDEALVRVYIEGNTDQERYWESLGRQVETSWEQVIASLKVEPRLYLRPTGLPMNEIDQRPMLDDADGVVLLWGKKTPDSLAAQIRKVEPKLSGPNYAPGVIAYLSESPADVPGAASVGNWPVVRFRVDGDGGASVLPDDAPALETFLGSVLARKRR